MTALWDHKTDITQSMLAETDSFITPKPGKDAQAKRYWEQRGSLLLPTRLNLPTVRTFSVRLPISALGSAWVPCKPNIEALDIPQEIAEKALCAYLNSSIGILAILGERSNKKPTYPNLSLDDLRGVLVPDFAALGAPAARDLAAAYDALCALPLRALPRIDADPVRARLDAAVALALAIPPERLARIRRHLSAEPSITAARYAP